MYGHWRDTLEQRLAGVNAAMAKIEEQMNRTDYNYAHHEVEDD